MSIFGAAMRGFGATLAAPRILVGLWLVSLLFALPFAALVGRAIGESIGASRVHEELRRGFDGGWYGEFAHRADGLAASFRPTVIGATAFYDNLEDWVAGTLFVEYPEVVAAGAAWAVLWVFLLGGVLDRFARPAESAVRGRFAQAGGIYFFRFLRLALLSGVLYLGIYLLHRLLLGWLEYLTRDATREWTVLWLTLALYLLTALLLTLVQMTFAYAKIATVVENRASIFPSALRGLRFVAGFPAKTLGLQFGLAAVSLLLLVVYSWLAPGPGQSGVPAIALAFLAGQAHLFTKLTLRLTSYGAATALFKSLAPRS
ncbi:MAG TPA: hypothetical protein VD788_17015 [Candidatus Polarisedimenticolaceae bacterium]|nr:hypothetical protein [Candidatus Polarisedimenticolaceae bacterium]